MPQLYARDTSEEMMCNNVLKNLCNLLFQYLGAPWHHNESSHCVGKNSDFSKVYEHIK
jgi:hypothetical protein